MRSRVAVVADGDNRTLEGIKVVFQNVERREVKVVRRFVENQHVRGSHQDTQKVQPPLFAAGQAGHLSDTICDGNRNVSAICDADKSPSGV